jgi:phage-related protein
MFPTIVITMNSAGGGLTLTNTTDSSRASVFTTLTASEVLTVNSNLEIISSSTTSPRLTNFNKKWPRFLPGKNALTWTGNISSIQFSYVNAVKIGG